MIVPRNPYYRALRFGLRPASGFPTIGNAALKGSQYGRGTRGIGFIRTPAGAALAAVAPFDFVGITDAWGIRCVFEFRPNGLPASDDARVQVVPFDAGDTAVTVANALQNAIVNVSTVNGHTIQSLYRDRNFLGVWALRHTGGAQQDEITLIGTQLGGRLRVDASAVFNGAPALAFGLSPARGMVVTGAVQAAGAIRAVPFANIIAGEQVTIDDGNGAVNFIFTKAGAPVVVAPDVEVNLDGLVSAAQVAGQLVAVLNSTAAPPVGAGPAWRITAQLEPTQVGVTEGLLWLTNDVPGEQGGSIYSGNLIEDTVAEPLFAVYGMAGGQQGSVMAPIRWGLSRGGLPTDIGWIGPQPG